MDEIYILVSGDGEYSDRSETPILAFTDESEARRVRDALHALCQEREQFRRAHLGKGLGLSGWSSVWTDAQKAVAERAAALLPEHWTLQDDYTVVPVTLRR